MGQYTEGQRLQGSDGHIYVVRNGVPVTEGAQPLVPNVKLPGELTGQSLSNQKTAAELAMTPDQAAELHQKVIAAQRENTRFVGDQSKHGQDYINSIPQDYADYRNLIPMIAHNQVSVGNVARSNNEAKLLIAGAKQFDPNYDPSLANVRQQALQAYTGHGDASQKIQALDRASNALMLLKQYSDHMGGTNTGYAPLNSLLAHGQQDTGDRLIWAKKFDALLPEAMGQLNTVLAGSTTVSGMNEIKAGLDPHASQAEREAAFEAYGHALINAGTDLKQGWNSAYGGKAAPPVWINPQNAAFLEKLTGAKPGSLGADDWHGLPGINNDGTLSPQKGPQFVSNPVPTAQTLPGAGGQPNLQLNGAAPTRAQIDPVLKAASGKIGQMLSAGTPDDKIIQFMQQSGINPADTSINQALAFRRTPDFTNWKNANPTEAYPIGPNFYTKQVPVTPARRLFNETAATGVGGDLAAGLASSANSIIGNRLAPAVGALGGDPQMAQTGMQLLQSQHPVSSLVGNVAGQLTDEGVAGLVPGAQALMASKWGRRGADAAYGAFYGSGNTDSPVSGGAEGAVTNALGGMFGRGLQSGAGKAMTGVKNSALQYLDNAGVPLTVGQIGRGSQSTAGHILGGVEDRLAGLPGFDGVIGTARKRGEVGFNQAAFNEAGVQGGLTGAPALDALSTIKDNAYNFINPLNLPVDAQFSGSQAGVRAAVPGMPGFGPEVGKTLDQIDRIQVPPAPGALPTISGSNWQSALSDVRGNKATLAGAPFSRQAVGAMGQIDDNLLGLADRQGPPGTVDNLNAANRTNAQFNTLSAALDNGQAQKAGQMFSPLQLDNQSRINTRNFGGRLASLTGQNRPFYDLTQSGLQVMPNLTPDSGTAGRAWLIPLAASAAGGLTGAATGGQDKEHGGELGLGYGAALGAAAMGPYSKVGQGIIQKALLADRPEAIQKLGDYLINNRRMAGMFGGGMARNWMFDPNLTNAPLPYQGQ